MFENTIAVIMAGGKSSRMKKDKSLLSFGVFSSLSEYQYRRLSQLFSKVYISAKEDKFNFEVDVIEDVYEESSPLVALISIFESIKCDEVFVLSVDAPFIDETLIARLYANTMLNVDVIVAQSQRGVEPLCAIYRRSFLSLAKKALERNNHRLQSLFDDLDVQKVLIDDEECFMNLNYPKDYEEAKLKIERED